MIGTRSVLHPEGATHRGSPFAGRRREIGILTHLIEEGLWGTLRLVRVAGEAGVGRRRLLAEALRRGPDAEWVDLAPGGVEADLPLWIRTELRDLLDTYPEAPLPSWALHVLARWEPRLRRRAAVPALSREALPPGGGPEAVGAAVGAILRALTGRTLVLVNAGLWPQPGSPRERALRAMTLSLASPGAVALTAAEDPEGWVDESGVRTLRLEPLRAAEVEELAAAWNPDGDSASLAGWLYRATKGHPFFLHETVRWLEELGHLRVDDDEGRVTPLDPVSRFPLPFNREAVMEARYQRLPPGAARLLHLITLHDGMLETDALRRRASQEDESFEESLAVLRRREFLLRRSFRRPVASAGTRWKEIVAEETRRMPRLAHRAAPVAPRSLPSLPGSPLAHSLAILARLRAEKEPASSERAGKALAAAWRLARGRTGPAWDGIRGRLAALAALHRERTGRPAGVRLWTRWGLSHLAPDRQPALRRTLLRLRVGLLEREGRADEADRLRETAREEALGAGHFLAAAAIEAAQAEGKRRRGDADTAYRLACRARRHLVETGQAARAELADYTALRSLVDARRLDQVEAELEERRASTATGMEEIRERVEELRSVPPLPVPRALDPVSPHPRGWGWGLDGAGPWESAREALGRVGEALRREGTSVPHRLLTDIAERLEQAGLTAARADLEELRVWMALENRSEEDGNERLETLAGLLDSMPPTRKRWLADRLRMTRAVGLPAFRERFQPLLARPVSNEPPPAPTAVTLFLLALPRVERSDSTWPMALWPEWWARLWGEAICRDCVGEPFPRREVERVLAEAGDAPRADLELLLHTADQLLREEHRVAGGLWLDGDRVRVNWSGIGCDLAALFREDEVERKAGHGFLRASETGAPFGDLSPRQRRVLERVAGPLLPGMEGSGVQAARDALRRMVAEAAASLREEGRVPGAEERVRWLEGPGRVVDVAPLLAEAMERAGRPRAAAALRRGSPSAGG